MPYVVSIATPEARDLVVAALRAAGEQRTRVARTASGQVATDKRAGKDVRPAAVRVVALLSEADTLESLAAELEAAEEVAVLSVDAHGALTTVPIPDPEDPPMPDQQRDDGTSPAAQALADLAGLTGYDPDEAEHPITGATSEDEPTTVEEVL